MIQSLRVEGFQSHHDSHLEFHPGVNVIVGPSDSGKSSIIRAIRWVAKNLPAGDDIITHGRKGAKVTLKVDGDDVVRDRSSTRNVYILDGKPLGSIGQGVPDEVTNLLNLSPFTFQMQMDAPFLLSSSSGEVARTLNRTVQLEDIDLSTKNIASMEREIKGQVQNITSNLAPLEVELQQLACVDELEAGVQECMVMNRRCMIAAGRAVTLQASLEDCDLLRKKIQEAPDIQAISESIQSSQAIIEQIELLDASQELLRSRIQKAKEQERKIREAGDIRSTISELGYLKDKIDSFSILMDRMVILQSLIQKIVGYQRQIGRMREEIRVLGERLKEITPKTCPLCKQPWRTQDDSTR